jgi:LptA/(LptD N-terminal domain) LPS transport protein
MMLLWMLYVVVVSVLLSGAALAAERIATVRRAPTRWHWVLSIAASTLVPAIAASAWVHVPRIPFLVSPAGSWQIVALGRMTSNGLAPSAWVGGGAKGLAALPSLNTLLAWVWAGASGTLLLALLVNAEARGNLRSDAAVVEFKDNQLRRATATGSPAEFEQEWSESGVVARGHADEIVYEGDSGTISLSNAYINDGKNDIQGPLIVYSLHK